MSFVLLTEQKAVVANMFDRGAAVVAGLPIPTVSRRCRAKVHFGLGQAYSMEDIELTIPAALVESLPADSEATEQDLQQAVAGWKSDLNAALDSDDPAAAVVDIVEYFEERWEAYDEYVIELRAWGQSPIYAMVWRDLLAAVIQQVYDHADLADRIDRERNARIVDDGIRPG
jgi:hypothetical protein